MGCQGDGAGGDWGRRRCGEHKVNVGSRQLSDHVTQLGHFSSTLTQLLHVSLPALQQLHRLRGAAVQGKMVSHTWQEVSCNKGKISVLSVVDRCKAEHLLYFFFFFKLKPKTQNVGKNVDWSDFFKDGVIPGLPDSMEALLLPGATLIHSTGQFTVQEPSCHSTT